MKTGFEAAQGDIVIIQDADLEYDPSDYGRLIEPILAGRTSVVLGIRRKFLFDKRMFRLFYWLSWLGNHAITWTTNLLYWNSAQEYEGCYKALTRKLAQSIEVHSDGFEFDNELICKILKRGHKTVDVSIQYNPRDYREGKKINWWDGFKILWTIVKYRFRD